MAIVSSNDIQILKLAGLSVLQAKVYLTLLRTGRATTRQVSNVAQIDRSDVYRTLISLRKIELVEEIIGTPRVYKAVSIHDGISILRQHKKEEYDQIVKATNNIAKKFRKQEEMGDEPQFCLTHVKQEAPNERMIQTWRSARESVSMYYGDKQNYTKAITLHSDVWAEFLRKGLLVRIIAVEPDKNETYKKIIDRLSRKPSFNLRYSSNIASSFVLFDDKEVWLSTGIEDGFKGSLWLWSNYPSIGKLFQGFFEKLWNEASLVQEKKMETVITQTE